MKHTTKPKAGYTIKQDGASFKVFDAAGKYRRPFASRAEADAYGASLSARRAPMAMDAGADLSGWGTAERSEPARVQVLQPALFGVEVAV